MIDGESQLRAGIVGPGGIGELHIKALRALGVPVRALVASSLESTRAHADRLGVELLYESVAAMGASGEVDVVHVCTPNTLHAAAAAQAIQAGCALVCEKPLTSELASAAELLRGTTSSSTKGGVCYHYRYFEGIAAARALVQSGALGSIRLLAGHYLSQELRELPDGHWLADPAIVGASMSLADVGVHWLDLAEHVSGVPVTAVACAPAAAGQGRAFAHGAALSLRFGEEAVGALAVSQDCYGISPDDLLLEVYGSAGSLRWSVDREGERLQAWCSDGTTLERTSYAQTLQSGTERAFEGLLADIYAAIAGRRSEAPTFADGCHGVAILDAALRSAAEGGWAEVPAF